jgi:single-stranded-DNA-specific exonuclease
MADPAVAAPLPDRTPAGPALAEPALAEPALRVLPGARAPEPPRSRLRVPAYDLVAALELERELHLSHVLAQALVRRGLGSPDAARAFLAADECHPPSAFRGLERALETIERHVLNRTRITVHGDYDVDGVCATAILVRSLRSLGAEVDWFIPGRAEDGYGLSFATVQRLAARGTRLLITADCAITAVEEVSAGRAAGLDVVVTDHHHPRADGLLPDCPLVHPECCGYPFAELCGSGVAYKLAEALGAPGIADEVELVALATVADLMPLRGENRRLVREGLAALGRTARPGLRALMEVAGADPSALDSGTLGFRLAPRINAAGRLRRADAGVELLLTADPARARQIALELDQLNAERRAVEQRIVWEAESRVAALGERPAYVVAGEGWHPGVVGIVASRIVERWHRPAIVIALEGDAGTGSGRSIPGFDLLAALQASAEHLERYGGHRAAAGISIARERIEAFTERFEEHARSVLTEELLAPVEVVDAVASGSELGLALAEELERLEPTGIGNPSIRLLVPGARLRDLRTMGEEGRHARFTVCSGGVRTPAVAFGCDGRLPVGPEESADASFRLERNCWNGSVEPRLVLRAAWACDPAPIAVLGESPDYLKAVLEALGDPLPGGDDPELPGDSQPRGDEPLPPGADPQGATGAPPPARAVLDRRGQGPLAVLADALAAGDRVLAVCAEVSRRLPGLGARTGGFSLVSYHALERRPEIAEEFEQLVALDPPAFSRQAGLLRAGAGFVHLAWGGPELRFAQQMHELDYGLRGSLVALYRALRQRGLAAGGELERLLRGDTAPGRPARLAARLIRVLCELELASLEPSLPALSIAGDAPTALERSAAYRAYAKRHEDGRRFLTSPKLLPSA